MGSFGFLEGNKHIREFEVLDYFTTDSARYYKLIIYFTDDSELHAREYIGDTERNYSFHWQKHQELICRWDNAPHHSHLNTFPDHVHKPNSLEESRPVTLMEVLGLIQSTLESNNFEG